MTTQELIKQMIERCGVIEETTDAYFLILAAQRLRELDKPDCIFTMCSDDSPTPNTLESGCDGEVLWYMGNPGENKLPKFCWHCGGAVKDGNA